MHLTCSENVGLNVVSVVDDGASISHRFFRMHSIDRYKKGKIAYKKPNIEST